jgi:kynurenine formamidase
MTAAGLPPLRVVDLTQPFADDMPVYPGLPRPSFRPIARSSATATRCPSTGC